MSDVCQLRASFAKRLECVELAPDFKSFHRAKSAGKPDALQTLRDLAVIADE